MKTIPITLLAYDSTILRAYLSVFTELNLRPEKIVVLLFNKLPLQKNKLLGSYFPNPLKTILLKKDMDRLMNYHPRLIKNQFPAMYQTILETFKKTYTFSDIFLESLNNEIRYEEFSSNIEYLNIHDYKDHKFISYINEIKLRTLFLYTGGGILPAAAFDNAQVKYLHVHPGYLPLVRGADCYLWSALLNNNIAASCFFMSPGIDEGNILIAKQFPLITVTIPENSRFETKVLYRVIYSYFDPCLRAQVLKEVLKNFNHIWDQKTTPQSLDVGDTFYFMNDFIKQIALKKVFRQENS